MVDHKQQTYWQTITRHAPSFLLLAIVATLPFNIQLNSYLIGFFVLSLIVQNQWKVRWQALRERKYWLLLFSSLWIIHVIGASYSTNTELALLQVERNLSMLIFPLAIFSFPVFTQKTLNRVLLVFVASCFLACLYCWAYNIFDIIQKNLLFHYFFKWRYSYLNLTNAIGAPSNYFSFYIVFALFALWYLLWQKNIRFQRVIVSLIVVVFVAFLFHLSARMSLLALVVTGMFHMIRLASGPNKWKPILLVGLFLLSSVLATMTFPILKNRFQDLVPVNEEGQFSVNALEIERFRRWSALIPLFGQNPLLGVGSGDDLQLITKQYKKHSLTTAHEQEYNAHNQFLQYAVANGLLGVGCFLGTLIIPFALSLRRKKWLYVYFILIFGLSSLTESTMRRNKGIVFYGLFSSVFAASFLANRPSERETTEILKL